MYPYIYIYIPCIYKYMHTHTSHAYTNTCIHIHPMHNINTYPNPPGISTGRENMQRKPTHSNILRGKHINHNLTHTNIFEKIYTLHALVSKK